MTRSGFKLTALALTMLLFGSSFTGRVIDERLDESFTPKEFQKLIIVGITDDIQARKNFENKFVSNLRGRGIGGVTSHSLVPDLMEQQDEEAIVAEIRAQGIDGAITVRVVPLVKPLTESGWTEAWSTAAEQDSDMRDLIDDSLPVAGTKAGKYGVEVALWETTDWDQIWAGRTDPGSRKGLRKNSGNFVQSVMDILTNRMLL